MRGKYKPKEKKFSVVCRYCSTEFLAADIKCYTCEPCKQPKPCKCGCGSMVNSPGRYYRPNHMKRGKTYLEIYGTSSPACGHQKGDNNAAKRDDVRQKISKGVLKSYQNPELINTRREDCHFLKVPYLSFIKKHKSTDGNMFRSKFEVEVAEFLYKSGIPYEYEFSLTHSTGTRFLIDFKVRDILIEVSGYAFVSWKQKFNEKLILMNSLGNKVLVIVREEHINEIKEHIHNNNLNNILVNSDYNSIIDLYNTIYVNKTNNNTER